MKPEYDDSKVRIVTVPDTRVAALEYRGDPQLLGDAVRRFIAWRKENALPPRVSATFNVVYRHPPQGEEGDCHYELCAATDRQVSQNAYGVTAKVIPGGRCAVLRHVGSEDTLAETVRYLYAQWLPRSGEELRDFPLYFERVKFYPDVAEHEAVTDVYLPLR